MRKIAIKVIASYMPIIGIIFASRRQFDSSLYIFWYWLISMLVLIPTILKILTNFKIV